MKDHQAGPEISASDLPHVVIQIHGTYARGIFRPPAEHTARWCRRGHICQRAIEEALGPDTEFHVFNWSGANAPTARLEAADRLADYIRNVRGQRKACVHLVAHSHGGNIAFYIVHALAVRAAAVTATSLQCDQRAGSIHRQVRSRRAAFRYNRSRPARRPASARHESAAKDRNARVTVGNDARA